MQKPWRALIFIGVWMGVLCADSVVAQTTAPPVPAPGPSYTSPSPETRYAPLGQVLPRVSRESGIQIQAPGPLLKEEVPVRESESDRNLKLEPVLDEFSRIELFGENSKLRKVIILNRNTGTDSQAPSAVSRTTPKPVRPGTPARKRTPQAAPQPLPDTRLSKEQLQKLIRGAYRSALPEDLWDDPEYREFLIGQGITSRQEMNDRNKAKNVRKTVRRLLWQLNKKS